MKALLITALSAAISLTFAAAVDAQYKAPSQYFPKNSPAPGGQPGVPRTPPPAPQPPKFKELDVNSTFYFLSDTNRAYTWTKISATTAKNTKNGVTQAINGETPVQR